MSHPRVTPVDSRAVEDIFAVPDARVAAIRRLETLLVPGRRVALSTHINSDGDGCGSEAALARLLQQRGLSVRIVNPTPWPPLFRFLLGDDVDDASAAGAAALADIDLLLVLDINDVKRLGQLAEAVRRLDVPMGVVDHHVPGAEPIDAITVADVHACATGELVYDIAHTLGLTITPAVAQALYVAILTDTGGFRFSNTSPRAHAVAAALLAAGVNPEDTYRRIYAQVSPGRLQLLREALGTLDVDETRGLTHMSITADAMQRHAVTTDDLDGLVEHARSVAGTRMALLFRDLGHGKVKVSFRSTGAVDVQQFASRFGGGGHVKASGALLSGALDDVRAQVVGAAREYLGD